jgi:hypothetical protein
MTPVIGCNIDNDHRPLKPVLWPKGAVLHPRRALDFRGFCFSWSRFCGGVSKVGAPTEPASCTWIATMTVPA